MAWDKLGCSSLVSSPWGYVNLYYIVVSLNLRLPLRPTQDNGASCCSEDGWGLVHYGPEAWCNHTESGQSQRYSTT